MKPPRMMLLISLIALLLTPGVERSLGQEPDRHASRPPEIPLGTDAFLQWERWPYLRVGVRAYMRSTFDRKGGNNFADAAHFIRQVDDEHNVVLDELGPGILWFVRHNHWHGSPWKYTVDGEETIVTESSTDDPLNPVDNSVYEPQKLFPKGLTFTWSITKGADLSWVPIAFEKSLELAYGRARYGTGYFIFWKIAPGLDHLSKALESWNEESVPSQEVLDLLAKSGEDIAPSGEGVTTRQGEFSLEPYHTRLVLHEQGPATLRRIAFRVPEADARHFAEATLRIYWDGAKQPSVEAPVGLFFGTASLLRDEDQEFIVKSFPMTVKYQEGEFLFATYFPMPFHEEARIEIADQSGESIDKVAWEVRHVPYEGAANEVGLFHATYRDFPRPERGQDLVLLDTRTVEGGGAWCGHIVGTTYQFTDRGELRTLEGDPRFYLDDSQSPQGQATGSEEWGGGGDYWGGRRMTLPFAGHPVGRPTRDAKTDLDRIHSAYRFLLSVLLPFGRNAKFTLEHGATNDFAEHYRTVTYWYGQRGEMLTQTDELDVGDEASEKRHAYRSPHASDVRTLASRHEWGVDHFSLGRDKSRTEIFPPTEDDGRHTRGTSEFVLAIHPENLGVMLRRRLDLSYPNQKAKVSVADVTNDSSPPQWKEAGTWYTAGGNVAVFGDPASVPKEQQTVHPEIAPPVHTVWESNRRWRDDEFLLPVELTRGRDKIRVRVEFVPVEKPLFPGHPTDAEAWTEYRYWAYSFVMPKEDEGK